MGTPGIEPATQEGPEALERSVAFQARRALRPEGLPRDWRLTRGSDLTAVMRTGRRRRTPRLDIFSRENGLGHPRVGVIVPRAGHSGVARNLLRRRLRELARRRALPHLPGVDVVIRSKPPAYDAAFDRLSGDIAQWVHWLCE